MASSMSGSSTPLSSTTTLSSPGSPHLHKIAEVPLGNPFSNPLCQASTLIEYVSSRQRTSSSVYVYDVAEQVGFGTLTKEWARAMNNGTTVMDLQTRPGAGLSLVGRLSQGTSLDAVKGTTLTAYITPSGLALMAPSFTYLPPANPNTRLVIQVPTVTPVGETLALSPTLSPLASVWSILPENVSVLLSSTPQQAVDFASLSYKVTNSHVIHLFDHHGASREIGHSITPLPPTIGDGLSVQEAVQKAGYQLYEYHGDENASNVIVLLNGPLALTLKAAIKNSSGLGVIIVNVIRPWNEEVIRSTIPSSVTTVHVLDDVPNSVTQGNLYVQVFGSLWNDAPKRVVHSHRLTPTQTQDFIVTSGAFLRFIKDISHINVPEVPTSGVKKVLLFSAPRSSLSPFATFLEDLFAKKARISSRLLTDHDVFSKLGGITANRLLIARSNAVDFLSVSGTLPLDPSSPGHSDFLGVLDPSLLKSHSILKHAKKGSIVLLVTSWTPAEVLSNIPQQAVAIIIERQLSLYTIDIKDISRTLIGAEGPIQDAIQNFLLELVFLRFYLGSSATEPTVLQLACNSFDDVVEGVPLVKLSSHAWSSLQMVSIPPLDQIIPSESPLLKEFEVNAIAVEIPEGQTVVNGARLSSWHEAAKHLLFPAVFVPQHEDSLSNPALRPEVPETTFLVTCTVNRRLTPLEYNRNVFHLEFDTSGTGLKYAIGEALGVHGWNDGAEVLDFCAWYGVDPERLITIPIPGDDTKMHTRTVLQALQQQIDLFGRPPKSFYSDLAEYAKTDVDRYALRFIGAPEGSATFKKLSEKDTVTFADVLKKYPSARPGIERLCELIGDIKPRHYSIASAQSVVGDRVDLLVVTVDWVTPDGPFYCRKLRYRS